VAGQFLAGFGRITRLQGLQGFQTGRGGGELEGKATIIRWDRLARRIAIPHKEEGRGGLGISPTTNKSCY